MHLQFETDDGLLVRDRFGSQRGDLSGTSRKLTLVSGNGEAADR